MILPSEIEKAKREVKEVISKIKKKYRMSAFIAEGIVMHVLADIREEELHELTIEADGWIVELSEELEKAKKAAKKVFPEKEQEVSGEDAKKVGQDGLKKEGSKKLTIEGENSENGTDMDA